MRSLVTSRADYAAKTINAIVEAVRAGARNPLSAAYDDLVGCFGARADDEENERRYGVTAARLFEGAGKDAVLG